MQTISEDHVVPEYAPRKLLVAIDDNEPCERALEWALREFYRPGDEFHLIHALPRVERPPLYGAPPVDFLPQHSLASVQQARDRAREFTEARFLPKLQAVQPPALFHVVEVAQETDCIGTVICEKADELLATAVVIASQGKGRFQHFSLGSTTAFVSKNCRVPVLIVH